ncbi:MAG: threonine-phosphate decarboxylase CobD [Gammaproteobacteria bacterium]
MTDGIAKTADECAPSHGGRLRAAAACYGIPVDQWLDLSTGINPQSWPVPHLPAQVWQRLPEDDDGLIAAAQAYCGTRAVLPVAGSQAAIQALPKVCVDRPGRVGVLNLVYAEHAYAWRRAGHVVVPLAVDEIDAALPTLAVLVIVNPNNPTGVCFAPETLLAWHAQLAARNAWLIVDEAFVDATPQRSLAQFSPRRGLVILRSLGKFFGLAGARVGFALAEQVLLERLANQLGPWTLAGPARLVAQQALVDRPWQDATRQRLAQSTQRLADLLERHGLAAAGGSALFQWVVTPRAQHIHEQLARCAILTRLFDAPLSLRFGLPGDEAGWQRLEIALAESMATMAAPNCVIESIGMRD